MLRGNGVVIGGYFRSGTTWTARLASIGERRTIMIEPDSNRDLPWADEFVGTCLGEHMDERMFVELLRMTPGRMGYKFTVGALRWRRYLEYLAARRFTRVVYIIRHLRGVLASHIYRNLPRGFFRDGVSANLLAAVNGGWPHNEDAEFFAKVCAQAEARPGTPYVTAAQWAAHLYDGTTATTEAGGSIVSYERMCLSEPYLDAVLGLMGLSLNQKRLKFLASVSGGNGIDGGAGIPAAIGRQRSLGHHANEAFGFLMRTAERSSPKMVQILSFAEANRV